MVGIVTLTVIRKMAFGLPKSQRVRLADELLEASIIPYREPVTLATLERRAEELRSGKVKGISDKEFETSLKSLERSIGSTKAARPIAGATRGQRIRARGLSSRPRPHKRRSS